MAVNQKAVKVLNKVFEAGFADEKAIASMTMDDILSVQGIMRTIWNRYLHRSMKSTPRENLQDNGLSSLSRHFPLLTNGTALPCVCLILSVIWTVMKKSFCRR